MATSISSTVMTSSSIDIEDLNVESPYNYIPGGYHPIQIDDKLHRGRYRILHKLGYGASSTVWLALNEHYGRINAPDLRYVALKILVARTPARPGEGTILRRLNPTRQSWLGRLRAFFCIGRRRRHGCISGRGIVPRLLDEFDILGPNGKHHCIITEVTGLSVSALQACEELRHDPLPLELARKTTIGLAKGVAFLHSLGVVHGGMN
jgi:serine/threonine-protein kinase SRPK3